jgi:hypothetical protein
MADSNHGPGTSRLLKLYSPFSSAFAMGPRRTLLPDQLHHTPAPGTGLPAGSSTRPEILPAGCILASRRTGSLLPAT